MTSDDEDNAEASTRSIEERVKDVRPGCEIATASQGMYLYIVR